MGRKRNRRTIPSKSYLIAVITITVLTVVSALSMLGSAIVAINAAKSEIQLTAGSEAAGKTFLQKLVDYCFPTADRYDYTKEEVQIKSVLSTITSFLFNVDFEDYKTIMQYQLHAGHVEPKKPGFIIKNGEIIYNGYEHLPEAIRLEINQIEDNWTPQESDKPVVMIYHTHSCEAYNPAGMGYTETEAWRTKDQRYNVVNVGSTLAQLLESKGIEVIHDTTDYESPGYSTAYSRTLQALKAKIAERDDIDMFIDLHRNAYFESAEISRALELEDGSSLARMMCVIGTGEGMEEKPVWQENYKLALRLTNQLNSSLDSIAYPVAVWDGRYNQHVSPNAVLIEVGHNMNTLDEANASMKYLADAIAAILIEG